MNIATRLILLAALIISLNLSGMQKKWSELKIDDLKKSTLYLNLRKIGVGQKLKIFNSHCDERKYKIFLLNEEDWSEQRQDWATAFLTYVPFNDPSTVLYLAVSYNDKAFIEFVSQHTTVPLNFEDYKEYGIWSAKQLMCKVNSLEMALLLKRLGAAELYNQKNGTNCIFDSFYNNKSWQVIQFFIEYHVPWTHRDSPLVNWLNKLSSIATWGSENSKNFDNLIKVLYVLSKTSYCSYKERLAIYENMIGFNIKAYANHKPAIQIGLKTLQHLYCCCEEKYQDVFAHTPELPFPQKLFWQWAMKECKTDLRLEYLPDNHRKRKNEEEDKPF